MVARLHEAHVDAKRLDLEAERLENQSVRLDAHRAVAQRIFLLRKRHVYGDERLVRGK